jgi:uncharacterized LabA/DUF88 family protein
MASVNTVLAISGFDVDIMEVARLDKVEQDIFRTYEKNCRYKIRVLNGITAESKKPNNPFDAFQVMGRTLLDKRPDLIPVKNIKSSKLSKGKSGSKCRYCEKIMQPEQKSWYCDATCKKLSGGSYVLKIKNIERITDADYKELISDKLLKLNERFNRSVSSREFVSALQDLVEKINHEETLYFYAYYIAARKGCATYITYHDMMSSASIDIKKWKGIKQEMLEKKSCKIENRVASMFKKYCTIVIKKGIIPAKCEPVVLKCYDDIDISGMTFRSQPKTVAIVLLCTILDKIGIEYAKNDFFNAVKMSPATVWKRKDAGHDLVENPGKYRRTRRLPEKPAILAVDLQPNIPVVEAVNIDIVQPTKPVIENAAKVDIPPMTAIKEPVLDVEKLRASILAELLEKMKAEQAAVVKIERNVHAIYIDLNNMFYIAKKQLGIRFNLDKLAESIHRAIMNADEHYDVKNITGHVYLSRQLMPLKPIFASAFDAFTASRAKEIASRFEWFCPTERKFENNIEKDQDIDTFLVADAIGEIIERSSEIKHVILASADKDLVPVLQKAKEKGMMTTVIGFRNFIPAIIHSNATKVIVLDDRRDRV